MQTKLLRAVLLFSAVVITFSSCYYPGEVTTPPVVAPLDRQQENFYYVPSSPNTRFLKEKNDLSFDVQRITGSRYAGKNLQASFLPTEHLGIIAGYSTAKNQQAGANVMDYRHFEVGAGYITKLSSGWHFENYAGIGSGKIDNVHYSGTSLVKYRRLFLQPAIAYTNPNRKVSLGFASRFSGVNFSVSEILFDPSNEPHSWEQIGLISDKTFHIVWEPSIIMNAGWRNFGFNAGYTYASDLTGNGLDISKSNLSLGVSLQFNTGKKKNL